MCQIFNKAVKISKKPIKCYKLLLRTPSRTEYTSVYFKDCKWTLNSIKTSPIEFARLYMSLSTILRHDHERGLICVTRGLHAFRNLSDAKRIQQNEVVVEMIIPENSAYVMGVDESTSAKSIVSDTMVFNRIIG